MKAFIPILIIFLIGLWTPGCYSFKSAAIAPEIETFDVEEFNLNVPAAPPNLNVDITNRLMNKIQQESRLRLDDQNPDIVFSGAVTSFSVRPVAPTGNETATFDRLEINVAVEFENLVDPQRNWSQNFSAFADFDRTQELLEVQDGLIDEIFDQISENIFNKAFSDW